jgi:DNA polymerase-1
MIEKYSNNFIKTNNNILILLPSNINKLVQKYYIDPHLSNYADKIISLELFKTKKKKKTPIAVQKEYLQDIKNIFIENNINIIVVCDAEYFKTLSGLPKAEPYLGYVIDSKCTKYKLVYCPNYQSIIYDPDKTFAKIATSLNSLKNYLENTYTVLGKDLSSKVTKLYHLKDIKKYLLSIVNKDILITSDIETFDFKHYKAGIASIGFAISENKAVAFDVDLHPNIQEVPIIRNYLKEFFINFKGTIAWHNISFDVYVLVYQLFMDNLLDQQGLLNGLEIMLNKWEDTKLIAYLATNSCAGNELGLKKLSHEFTGNYALDDDVIKNIKSLTQEERLTYNGIDCLATYYVYNKYYNQMINDNQYDIYINIFKPAIKDIIQMQLTGLPINMQTVLESKKELSDIADKINNSIRNYSFIKDFEQYLNEQWAIEKNQTLKKKRVTFSEGKKTFNPGSSTQLVSLLYSEHFFNLPIIDVTEKGTPATGKDTLEKLIHKTTNQEYISLIKDIVEYSEIQKLLSSFIKAFEEAVECNGWHYLFGSFNLGGTKSGRLSSSKPNLQNIPSGRTTYGKLIKKCVEAPKGYIFVGIDADALEDKISALTTKDPNKLKVYIENYDGHSLRAYTYFGDNMKDINPNCPLSINTIKDKYPMERYESKAPTFALTYQGTINTLINKSGFGSNMAKHIYDKYHELYAHSTEWVKAKLAQASIDGYITAAFGLRVRTPLLKQVVLDNSKTPYEAQAESRTAGNALGQSWCLLNTRAGSEFLEKVRNSVYALYIKPCAQIHDAQYYLIKDDIEVLMYLNEHLPKAISWQDHPDIYHDIVKLSGSIEIYYPNWTKSYSIKNNASKEDIINIVKGILNK